MTYVTMQWQCTCFCDIDLHRLTCIVLNFQIHHQCHAACLFQGHKVPPCPALVLPALVLCLGKGEGT